MRLGFIAELEAAGPASGGWGEESVSKAGDTILDRFRQATILFAAGRSESLRYFLVDVGAGRGRRLRRLAQVLSALYPSRTDEKMLGRRPPGTQEGVRFAAVGITGR
jgi:hypothetical protein